MGVRLPVLMTGSVLNVTASPAARGTTRSDWSEMDQWTTGGATTHNTPVDRKSRTVDYTQGRLYFSHKLLHRPSVLI